LERVLDAICEATAEIMGESIVGIRLVDEENPDQAPLVAWVGLDEVPDSVRNRPTRSGLSGRAMNERRLVVATDYRATLGHDHWYEANGICSSMAAPVTRDNVVVGGMIVSSTRPRQFSPLEQETLLTFAEHVSLALNDASALTAMSEALDDALHQATHDPLTSLPNRALVLDRLGLAIGRTGRTGTSVTLLFVDLDRFKRVNDYLGHHQGDAVLIAVAQRLTACLRPGDTVGRLAGDEFVVIAEDLDDAEAGQLATRLADAIAEPLPLDGRDLVVTASIGIARGAVGVRAEELLGDADVALYRAKAEGRSRIERFDQALRTRMATRSETEQALRRAMRDHELRVWFQPTIWSPTREPLAVEALVRWERPGHGLVAPADFIPLAEDTGQIVPLGAWVLEEACRQVATWRAEEPQLAHLLVAVNLSPRQLTDPGLSGLVARVLRDTGLPADALWLEITEHVFLEEDEATLANMQALHRAGVRFVMDDFGTGYSSLTYLKRFPVSSIKIDRSFVDGVGRDHGDEAIVTAIIRLGEAMGLAVVAEGVERAQQVTDLHRLGCDMVQGYFFGRPAPADEARRAMLEMVPAEPPRAGDREERPRAGAQP
jgi:diguanylate cyclase (GGDEF)-like protein